MNDPGLCPAAKTKLQEYQKKVNQAGSYADQVAAGKRLFGNYNRPENSTFSEVRKQLTIMCTGAQRCVYCTDSVGDEIEHVKPKDLYPEEVFRWPNYVYACGICNGRKSNKFSVINRNKIVDVTRPRGSPIKPPISGEPVFVNPRLEDPLDYMMMDLIGTFWLLPRMGIGQLGTKRAEFTIETLDLNRELLLHARRDAFQGFLSRLSDYGTKRNNGASNIELDRLRDSLLTLPHLFVWEEMKKRRADFPQISELFSAVPEALKWDRDTIAA